MNQLKEAICDGNVFMVDALLTADWLLFVRAGANEINLSTLLILGSILRIDSTSSSVAMIRGGSDLTSCIVDAADEGKVAPLVLAIQHENVDMVNVFIEAGASLKGGRDGDVDELTPMMYAIDTGNVNVINALTAAGASLEAECEGDHTPLEYAIGDGNINVIKALIEAGASLEAGCEDYRSPLEHAIDEGKPHVIKALLEAGASLEAAGEYEYTPLEYAIIEDGNLDVIKALIEAGVSLEATCEEVCTPLEYAIKYDKNADVINVLKDAERARSDTACLKAIFSEEYAMPDVELDFEPSHEGHVDLPWPPKAWISSASGEWRQVNLR